MIMMTTTPADPGAIDLESYRIKQRSGHVINYYDIKDLIAAVEALRARVAELLERAEAAEARVGELAGALRSLYVETGKLTEGTPAFRDAWLRARGALAITPTLNKEK